MENLQSLKVIELRQLCRANDISVSGKKEDLVKRLKMAGYGDNANGVTLGVAQGDSNDLQEEVSQYDSVSQTGRSKAPSKASSKASSVSSRAKAAARRASLEVKARFLEKQQQLEYMMEKEKMIREIEKVQGDMALKDEQLKLKMELDKLKLEAEIHATAAEEEVLASADTKVKSVASGGFSYKSPTVPRYSSPDISPPVLTPMKSYSEAEDLVRKSTKPQGDQAPGIQGQSRSGIGVAPGGIHKQPTQQHSMPQGPPMSKLNPLAEEFKSGQMGNIQEGDVSTAPRPLQQQNHAKANHITLKAPSETSVSSASYIADQHHTVQQQLLDAVNLPKTSLHTFDGNPLQYHMFITAFDNMVDNKLVSNSTKLNILVEHCTGKAAKIIQCCVLMSPEEGYWKARQLLAERFGNEYTISEAWIQKLASGPQVRPNSGSELQEFADEVLCCMETLKAMGMLNQVDSRVRMVQIVNRLPLYLQSRWRKEAVQKKQRTGTYPGMGEFVIFLNSVASEINDPVFGIVQQKQQQPKNKPRKSSSFHTQAAHEPSPTAKSPSCPMCKGDHWLYSCKQFRDLEPDGRMEFVRSHKLCYNCLKPGRHIARYCRIRNVCGVQGCKIKHCNLLHNALSRSVLVQPPGAEGAPVPTPDDDRVLVTAGNGDGDFSFACGSQQTHDKIALPIIPVKVKAKGQGRYIYTHALLDPGSNKTFCSSSLLKLLDMEGKATSLSLSTINETKASDARVISLEVMGNRSKHSVQLPQVYALDTFPSLVSSIADPEEVQKWDHLKDIAPPEVKDTSVLLLIGQDVPAAVMPLEVRHGSDAEPYAVRTRLGWVISGPVGEKSQSALCNFIHSVPVRSDDSLSEQVELFWKMDDVRDADESGMSVEDRRVLEIWDKTTQIVDGHYQFDIPFKTDPPELPDNKYLAERRLDSLGRRLGRDPDLLTKYKATIEDLLEKGYAEPVPDAELEGDIGTTWYLPHHSVVNPNKSKIRVVFDCSAEYRGTSLNQNVLQGPDLTNGLLGVLLRFRQERIAIMADIEGMFHQVKVTPSHRNVLRFLWWEDGNPSKKIKVYRMTAHLFGGVWSPSAANYALRRTATDQAEDFDEVTVQTVKENFYMDDGLKSLRSEQEAIELVQELCSLLKRGGFRLTKWVSNNKQVIKSIPEDERAKDVKDLNLPLPSERALGVQWLTETDTFGIKVKQKEKPPTRRGLLSTMSSVYDPFGFVAPHVMQAKMLFQDECKMKKGWDDELEPANLAKWSKWLQNLHLLENLQMDRCVVPDDFGPVVQCNLHHFSDASERAYGAVSYLRSVNEKGEIHCTFLLAKSRLAPIRTLTIPRLELCAAALAVQIDAKLKRELQLDLGPSVFHTDSTIVLQYIQNTQKRFKTFVANRISTIHSGSEPSQWHHITSTLNPADDVSRGLDAEKLVANIRWHRGPDFLWMSTENWQPTEVTPEVPDDDEELKPAKSHTVEVEQTEEPLDQLINGASSWFKLRKSVCWLRRFVSYLAKKESQPKDITVSEIEEAEVQILKYVQRKHFSDEISELKNRGKVAKNSPVYSLEANIGEDGLLRVGGRLTHAPVSYNTKHPVILPRDDHVTRLIVRHVHEVARHAGREHILALTRERYWILRARPVIRQVLQRCVTCKRLQGSLETQKMADLPDDRLTPNKPPFTYVGVDCFGPFLVKRGRGREKRYGCLFTCLTTRAIHIEKLSSLDTDAFINGLVRFCARRGKPEKIRSDNATNFVGSQRELVEAIAKWNESNKFKNHLLLNGISWEFNPPSASHQGGVWERQIRSVRKTLNAVLKNQVLDDERLETVFCEAEQVVNSRPLTYVSSDPKDEGPITPNHLLLLRDVPTVCPGHFTKDDVYSRRWRHVQYIADCFWRRWLKEYLPVLQLRQKWIQPRRDIQIGDIVLVAEQAPRKDWPLAKVVNTFQGRDGRVRSAELRTKNTILMRPIQKLCLLESVD